MWMQRTMMRSSGESEIGGDLPALSLDGLGLVVHRDDSGVHVAWL